ncbi:hypothetical protein RHECNPAF_14110031 [Rhizobium etli CNPAF512]|nr:hypothetical protein RHECNPAF_14110031 [Rhizobium etli CNPAF512]
MLRIGDIAEVAMAVIALHRIPRRSNHQQPLPFSDGYHRPCPGVELQKIRLDAVAEDDAVFRHFRDDGQRLGIGDEAGNDAGAGGATREGFADEIAQVIGVPGKRHIDRPVAGFEAEGACGSEPAGIEALQPAGRAHACRDDDAAGGLALLALLGLQEITGRDMALRADEEIVDRVDDGAGIQRRLRHADALDRPLVPERLADHLLKALRIEGKQQAIPALGIGIDAKHRLTVEIFQRIGDQPVLAEHDDDIVGAEDEVREVAAVESLHAGDRAQAGLDLGDRRFIALLLGEVIAEIGAEMFDIELRLLHRVEPGDEFVEAGRADDQDDLAFVRGRHGPCPPAAAISRAEDRAKR